jgi:hypothetical protein
MNDLFKKSKIDLTKLSRMVRNVSGTHLANLSEPCYYPEHKATYFELLNACGLTDVDIKQWIKEFWRGMPQADWDLQTDPGNMLNIFLLWLFLKERDDMSYRSAMVYYMVRIYSNLMRRQMKFCNADIFKYTLDHLAKTHLFVREKSIPIAIYYLCSEMMEKYTSSIKSSDKLRISKFIQESRGRLSQSIKSFAESYYENHSKGLKYTTPYESEEGEEAVTAPTVENIERIADEIARTITIYGEIRVKNIEIAQKDTKISGTFADDIVKQVSNPEYKDDVKLAIELFLREVTSVNQICKDREYFSLITDLLSIKRTIKQVYFKKQITEILHKVVRAKHQEKKFIALTRQTQFSSIKFLALYITSFVRDLKCGPTK